MFPCMSPEGASAAIAWCAAARIIDRFDQGLAGAHPKVDRPTAQQALDAVCARARSGRSTFTVDVTFSTHDDLQQGVTGTGVSRVIVVADDGDDAQLVAAQITACRGVMPTATTVCI